MRIGFIERLRARLGGVVKRIGQMPKMVRKLWRERVRDTWRDFRTILFVIAAFTVVGLGAAGFWGWSRNEVPPESPRDDYSVSDSIYRSFQLFGVGGGNVENPPLKLEIARFLGPVIVGWAAIAALMALSREQLQLLAFRRRRNHIVVAGLGLAGSRIATGFHKAGERVVAIEQDPTNPAIATCRTNGIGVLKGDATKTHVLRQAGVQHAKKFYISCALPAVNLAVSYAAQEIVSRHQRIGQLTAYVELDELDLWRHMKAHPLRSSGQRSFRREFFNAFAAGAQMLLDENPPFPDHSPDPICPHVLIFGLDGAGTSLLLGVIKRWQNRETRSAGTLRITISGESAEQQFNDFLSRFPQAEEVERCELATWNVHADSVALKQDERISGATIVYVSLADEAEALRVAQRLRTRADLETTKIVVAVEDDSSAIPNVLEDSKRDLPEVHAFGVLSIGLTPEALTKTVNELLARAIHEEHRRARAEVAMSHSDDDDDHSLLRWDDLHENLKQSNRRFADAIRDHLWEIKCVVVPAPLIDPNGSLERLTEDEVEHLAPREHDRWDKDQQADGWKRTDGHKDPEKKLHPNIGISWKDLADSDREKDRAHVRAIPDVLALAGFEMVRLSERDSRFRVEADKGQGKLAPEAMQDLPEPANLSAAQSSRFGTNG
jgi:hypothetical protein